MTCRELVELITDYLEGALSPERKARFEGHVARCAACTTYIGQLRTTRRVLSRLREEDLPVPIREELLSAFRTWKS